jgi:hypothetical protein
MTQPTAARADDGARGSPASSVRPACQVVSYDHHLVGCVDIVVSNPFGEVTHFVLDRGDLWGRRWLLVPICDVIDATDSRVVLGLPGRMIGAYPTVDDAAVTAPADRLASAGTRA